MINTYNYRTRFIQIIEDVHTVSKNMEVDYTSILEEHEHARTRAKQEVVFSKQV